MKSRAKDRSIINQLSQILLYWYIRNATTSQDEECVCTAVEILHAGFYELLRGQMIDLMGFGYLRIPADPQLLWLDAVEEDDMIYNGALDFLYALIDEREGDNAYSSEMSYLKSN